MLLLVSVAWVCRTVFQVLVCMCTLFLLNCWSKESGFSGRAAWLFSGLWVGFRILEARVVLQAYTNIASDLLTTQHPPHKAICVTLSIFPLINWNSIRFSLARRPKTDTDLTQTCCAVGRGSWKWEYVALTFHDEAPGLSLTTRPDWCGGDGFVICLSVISFLLKYFNFHRAVNRACLGSFNQPNNHSVADISFGRASENGS